MLLPEATAVAFKSEQSEPFSAPRFCFARRSMFSALLRSEPANCRNGPVLGGLFRGLRILANRLPFALQPLPLAASWSPACRRTGALVPDPSLLDQGLPLDRGGAMVTVRPATLLLFSLYYALKLTLISNWLRQLIVASQSSLGNLQDMILLVRMLLLLWCHHQEY